MLDSLTRAWVLLAAAVELVGIFSAAHAIMRVRSPRGVIAWAIALVTIPYLAVPLYWIFGRYRFMGYVAARRSGDQEIDHVARLAAERIQPYQSAPPEPFDTGGRLSERLAGWPFLGGNEVRLLVNGQETFEAMFDAIEAAREYIVVQFFIVRDDHLGREMKARLTAKARAGVRVYFLYDGIGSRKLSKEYLDDLRLAGVQVASFGSSRIFRLGSQVNFRNHRKVTVVDGRMAFAGGLNLGDEYMGRHRRFGPWRDTHAQVRGPAVLPIQMSFLQDWYYCTRFTPELLWEPQPAGHQDVLVAATGPSDEFENCHLLFLQAIHSARRRLWIASPYFVPDHSTVAALQLAALRGVDVRIILPQRPDHLLVYLSAFSYYEEMLSVGAHLYRYQPGFMHQKVLLVDDTLAVVSTVNLDNRSFYLNFEMSLAVADAGFIRQVHAMLEEDLGNCRRATHEEFRTRPLWFRVVVRLARIMSPIQ